MGWDGQDAAWHSDKAPIFPVGPGSVQSAPMLTYIFKKKERKNEETS